MKGLSKKEIEIISSLEFDKKYFFLSEDIDKFSESRTQRYNIIKNLLKKGRIVKLNRKKYYLVPIKAKSGSWSEYPFIVADEMFNGASYFIGGWSAANYWKFTDQIPMQIDIYTTKRQGKARILNKKFVFHRTTEKKIRNAIKRKIGDHDFIIQNRGESKKWIKSRN